MYSPSNSSVLLLSSGSYSSPTEKTIRYPGTIFIPPVLLCLHPSIEDILNTSGCSERCVKPANVILFWVSYLNEHFRQL